MYDYIISTVTLLSEIFDLITKKLELLARLGSLYFCMFALISNSEGVELLQIYALP